MARKKNTRLRLRLIGAALLLLLAGGAWTWWHLSQWTPPREEFPVQGVEIGGEDGPVDWVALKTIGADFVYLDASASAFARDPKFVENVEAAKAASLQWGAVHRYDPCQPAEKQAANFVTVVPRDSAMLPAAVWLDQLAGDCPIKVSDAAVESELTTFLNQIETHTGKAAVLKVSRSFERRYQISARIDRNVWLEQLRFQPDYAGRPWAMWTANDRLTLLALEGGIRWVVVRP